MSGTILLSEAQARWAYSEVVDGTLSEGYAGLQYLDALRLKRQSGVSFSDLNGQERYALAFACACARTNLMVFCVGCEHLTLVQLTKHHLAKVLVPSMCSGLPDMLSFHDYVDSPAPADPKDARNVPAGYSSTHDPLTIGRCFDWQVLVDGYHRAVSFWRSAPTDTTIPAFVPT